MQKLIVESNKLAILNSITGIIALFFARMTSQNAGLQFMLRLLAE
jgi:hypothetical protein